MVEQGQDVGRTTVGNIEHEPSNRSARIKVEKLVEEEDDGVLEWFHNHLNNAIVTKNVAHPKKRTKYMSIMGEELYTDADDEEEEAGAPPVKRMGRPLKAGGPRENDQAVKPMNTGTVGQTIAGKRRWFSDDEDDEEDGDELLEKGFPRDRTSSTSQEVSSGHPNNNYRSEGGSEPWRSLLLGDFPQVSLKFLRGFDSETQSWPLDRVVHKSIASFVAKKGPDLFDAGEFIAYESVEVKVLRGELWFMLPNPMYERSKSTDVDL
ncbi:hypothetical protein LTR50_006104 [Elasticomyces elasticus]|nr:hypothetical protein LTR50_006104 [Elasticomyces elasticus]